MPLLRGPRERIARARVARVHAAVEPLDALRRRAVRESIRGDVTGRHLLQTVVANGRGGAQRVFGVAGFELYAPRPKAAALPSGVAPDAGEAIGL